MSVIGARPTFSANTALWSLWALFCLTLIVVGLQDGSRNPGIAWWEPLLWEGSSAVVASLWFAAQRGVDARYAQYLDRPWLWSWHHAKWLPLVAATFVPAIYAIRHGVYELAGKRYMHESWPFLFAYESLKLVLFAGLWLGIIFGFNSFVQWRSQRERLLAVQNALAQSQLQQLRAQLQPHFLFNALNTISSLMHVDPDRADRLLARLGDLLRMSLQVSRDDRTALREELQMLELYSQIMEERFVGRVAVTWDIAADTLNAAVPALLLQPLLENAFKHGVGKNQDITAIHIESRRSDAQLVLAIVNTGAIDARRADGIGLRNCRDRLRLLYADAAAMDLVEGAGAVAARVRLPYQEHAA